MAQQQGSRGQPTWQQGGEESHDEGMQLMQDASWRCMGSSCSRWVPSRPGITRSRRLHPQNAMHGLPKRSKASHIKQSGNPHDEKESAGRAVLQAGQGRVRAGGDDIESVRLLGRLSKNWTDACWRMHRRRKMSHRCAAQTCSCAADIRGQRSLHALPAHESLTTAMDTINST